MNTLKGLLYCLGLIIGGIATYMALRLISDIHGTNFGTRGIFVELGIMLSIGILTVSLSLHYIYLMIRVEKEFGADGRKTIQNESY